MKQFDSANTIHITQLYDGDGLPAYRLETHPGLIDRATIYYIRSSVLGGQTITELKGNGGKRRTYVYAGGGEIARQEKIGNAPDSVTWMTRDPITGDEGSITRDPLGGYLGNELSVLEPDYAALKGDAPTHDTDADPFDSGSGCTLDGVPIGCSLAIGLANHGGAVQAPLKSIIPVTYLGQRTLAVFQAFSDGYQGFVPVTARYTGEGHIISINPPKLFRRGQLSGDTDLRRLNGVGDDDPEASLARSISLVGFTGGGQRREYPQKYDKGLPTSEDVRKIPTPPPWSSCGDSVTPDVKSIFQTYRESVFELTRDKLRNEDGFSANLCTSLYIGSLGSIGHRYLGCGEQVDKVTSRLRRNRYQDTWRFEIESRILPFPHQWGRAQSANPDNPTIIYDPWNNTIYCEKKR